MYYCMFTGCHLFCIHFQEFEIESTEQTIFCLLLGFWREEIENVVRGSSKSQTRL